MIIQRILAWQSPRPTPNNLYVSFYAVLFLKQGLRRYYPARWMARGPKNRPAWLRDPFAPPSKCSFMAVFGSEHAPNGQYPTVHKKTIGERIQPDLSPLIPFCDKRGWIDFYFELNDPKEKLFYVQKHLLSIK